jgi:hypothetical protein
MAVTWKKLAYEADVMLNSVADANSILYAVTDNTPAALAMAASTIPARLATGNVVAATVTEMQTLLNVENGADVTDATNVAAAGAVMESDFSAKGALVAGTGVGTAGVLAVGANDYALVADSTAVTGLKWAAVATGNFKSDGTVAMSGNLALAGNQITNQVIQTVANVAAVNAYATPVVGKILWSTAELAAYICTVSV